MKTSRTEARAFRTSWLGWAVLAGVAAAWCLTGPAHAAVLVDGFMTEYDGWTNTFDGWPVTDGGKNQILPKYGILVLNNALVEVSDGRPADGGATGTLTGTAGDGTYIPFVMVNKTAMTPSTYNLAATMSSTDDDGLGIVFGYQDNNNYFRAGIRAQTNTTYGFGTGLSVQKVVDGVITQLHAPNSTFLYDYVNNTPFDLAVSASGTSYTVSVNNLPIFSGSDSDLQAGYYGVMSWGERYYSNSTTSVYTPFRGAQLHSMTVSSTTLNKTHTFDSGWAAEWKPLVMYNSGSVTGADYDDQGNFRLDFCNGTINNEENGYEWATTTTPNVDFIGPAIIVGDTAAQSLGDIEMRVRMSNTDNDGLGVLVRVQESIYAGYYSFYRVNFSAESMGTGTTRAPQGMSIQKCVISDIGPVWTELYREDQSGSPFAYSYGTSILPFDVKVVVEGNTISVQVINDPDGAATVINYADVVDADNPLLTGTVGLQSWGSTGVTFGGWGGDPDAPLVVEIGTWPDEPEYHAGDANGDGKVDDLDASILAANWQRTGDATWGTADFNGDTNVNDLDASILAANWQYGVGAAVPEPGTVVLLGSVVLLVSALAVAGLLIRRK